MKLLLPCLLSMMLASVALGDDANPNKLKEAFTGMPLPDYDEVWDSLHAYYGAALPSPVYIAYTQGGISGFDGPDTVVLSFQDLMNDKQRLPTLAHEASHLGNYSLTAGQSSETPFRFIDEGFAGLWQFRADIEGFKGYTMDVAKDYLAHGKVSFAQVQDWSSYFGSSPDHFDYKAYNVGSSFVFFLTDTYGEDGFRRLLTSIGQEKDLGRALKGEFGISMAEAEANWVAYIRRFKI